VAKRSTWSRVKAIFAVLGYASVGPSSTYVTTSTTSTVSRVTYGDNTSTTRSTPVSISPSSTYVTTSTITTVSPVTSYMTTGSSTTLTTSTIPPVVFGDNSCLYYNVVRFLINQKLCRPKVKYLSIR